jgi:hypothetical protein
MNNLKIAMILYGAINIAEGILMWFVPGSIVSRMFGVDYVASEYHFFGYVFVLLGAASLTAGLLMIVAGLKPLANVNVIRFSILWSALVLLGQIYSLGAQYITWGDVLVPVVLNFIFLLGMVIFYPWRVQTR